VPEPRTSSLVLNMSIMNLKVKQRYIIHFLFQTKTGEVCGQFRILYNNKLCDLCRSLSIFGIRLHCPGHIAGIRGINAYRILVGKLLQTYSSSSELCF
jgi:hypothetical protein